MALKPPGIAGRCIRTSGENYDSSSYLNNYRSFAGELNRPNSGEIWERQDDQGKMKTAQTTKLWATRERLNKKIKYVIFCIT